MATATEEIFSDKFFEYREPAWDNLGVVSQRKESVFAAAKRLNIPKVTLEPLKSGELALQNFRAIVGSIGEGEQLDQRCYGVVTRHYKLLDHDTFLQVYDDCIPSHIETMGIIEYGKRLFVTTRLPSFDIAHEEVTNYLLAINPVDGKSSVLARPTGIRMVCWNMMIRALSEQVSMEFIGRHMGDNLVQRLEIFLHLVWETQAEKLEVMKEAYELLARTPSTDKKETVILDTILPLPPRPDKDSEEDLEQWERARTEQELHREYTTIFAHESPNNRRIAGTLWGFYQGGLEYEQHMRKYSGPRSVIFGDGAKRAKALFDACMKATVH